MTKYELGWRVRLPWLLAATVGLALLASGSAAAGPPPTTCTAPSHPVSGLTASIDTSGGCNNPNGTAVYPKTGFVAYNPGAGSSVQLLDGFEGLSTHKFYWGTYTFCLYPTYGTVSQTCSTYTVTQNTGSYPSTPPTFSGTLPVITGGADGSFVAQYTLTVQNEPTGHLNSAKDDFWVLSNNVPVAHTATQSVKPPTLTTVPNIFLGYGDDFEPRGTHFPSPWLGSPNTTFIGCGVNPDETGGTVADGCPQQPVVGGDYYDGGAIRIDNPSSSPLVVSGPASVTIGVCPLSSPTPGIPAVYTPWPGLHQTIPPGGTLILTQTGLSNDPCGQSFGFGGIGAGANFDTSEAAGNGNCNPTGAIPVIQLTIGGVPTTITDTAQILNKGGTDPGACNGGTNEFQDWTPA